MAIFSSTEAKQRFGVLLDTAQREPVHVQRHDRDIVVVISAQDYDEYRRLQLKQLLQQGLQQRPDQRPGNDEENAIPHVAENETRSKPRATIEEFREFLKFMSSQPHDAPNLREKTFSREFLYGEHD